MGFRRQLRSMDLSQRRSDDRRHDKTRTLHVTTKGLRVPVYSEAGWSIPQQAKKQSSGPKGPNKPVALSILRRVNKMAQEMLPMIIRVVINGCIYEAN